MRKRSRACIRLRAALDESIGVRAYMAPTSSHMYEQASILRLKLLRWHPDNWAELLVLALGGTGRRVRGRAAAT